MPKIDGKPAYSNKITRSPNPALAAESDLHETIAVGRAAINSIPVDARPFMRYLTDQVDIALSKATGSDGHITMARLAEQRQYFDQEHYPGVKEFVEAARQESACVGY